MASSTKGKYIPPQLRTFDAESLRVRPSHAESLRVRPSHAESLRVRPSHVGSAHVIPSRGIEHFFNETLSKSEKPNIYNLDEYCARNFNPKFNKEQYLRSKAFITAINDEVGKELDLNEGNIIDIYSCDGNTPEDNAELESIKMSYQKLYLDGLPLEGHKTNKQNQVYPNYYEDLYQKGYKPYETLEQSLGLARQILEQSDEEFLETLDKRIAGLKKCTENLEGQKPDADVYFVKEQARENAVKDIGRTTLQTSQEIIEESCKAIYYSQDTLEASEKIKSDTTFQNKIINQYDAFFKEPKEVVYARTFLPDKYFLEDGKINMKEIKKLIIDNNRDLRQFVFGFFDSPEFKHLRKLTPFLYEVGGMQQSIERKVSCNPLVNWSLLLNLLYCRCSIMNSTIPFPVRFIIPDFAYTKVLTRDGAEGYYDANGNYIREIVIRDKLGLNDLFDDSELGMIVNWG